MDTRRSYVRWGSILAVMLMVTAAPVWGASERGRLRVYVQPVEAEIFIDGQHMGDASFDGTLTIPKISPGEHTVSIYNYGFVPQTSKVTIEAGKTVGIHVRLEPVGGTVPGPWGRIEIKGAPRAAVLLNGKTPEYVVGHGNEFDGGMFLAHEQELLVPPGTYQVGLVHGDKEIWSGPVTVAANQKAVVNVKRNGEVKTVAWTAPSGEIPRFRAGLASTTVAVSPLNAQFAADPAQINCGESSRLKWTSTGAARAEISGVGEVPRSGDRQVNPKQTTTYTLTATGSGGTKTLNATLNVTNAFNASLDVSPQEVRYHKIGQKVMEQGSAAVNWSTAGADTVSVEPFGPVDASGSRKVQPAPQQSTAGPVNETVTYTLKATNACGGEETRTATLHLVGSIELAISATETSSEFGLALVSVFYPTDYPDQARPGGGLLKSQQAALARLATTFKKYLEYDSTARLGVEAHADQRASARHNQELSERRASRVKEFLASQGVPANAVDTAAFGKEQQLARTEVKQLETQNPNTPPKQRVRATTVDWLAYNRRVDLVLRPSGQRSSRYYPHTAPDASILWQQPKPRWKVVEQNQ